MSITTLTGDNGILTQAQNAKRETKKETAKETVQIEVIGAFDDIGLYAPDVAIENLKNKLGVKAIKNEDNTLNLSYNGYSMKVNSKGIVTIPEQILSIKDNHTPVTLSYSWEELNKIAKAVSNNYSTVNNRTEEITVSIDGKNYTLGIGDKATVNYNGTEKVVRIIGFNHDKLENTKIYGDENSYAGISFEFVDFITSASMNGSNTNSGGWAQSVLRSTMNDITSGIIDNLSNKEYIKKVKKSYIEIYNDATSVKESTDYLWLLSCSEVWNNGREDSNAIYGYAIAKEGEQYKYYLDINADANNNTDALIKNSGGWWLRSPFVGYKDGFCFVDKNGLSSCIAANNNSVGVTPGFAI